MRLWLTKRDTEDDQGFTVDFIPQLVVNTPELYLLIYSLDTYRYIGEDVSIKTPVFKEFHLTRLHHIIYGQFTYDNKKYDAQVGCFLRKYGVQGFDSALLRHDPIDFFFANSFIDFVYEKRDVIVIDLEDFNKARRLVGHNEISFKDYLTKRLTKRIANDIGLTIHDETSLFNVIDENLKAEEFITAKGMEIFFEEEIKKNSR